ncbi:hypothetical protein Tco_1265994 [Tanacetum coccineum]
MSKSTIQRILGMEDKNMQIKAWIQSLEVVELADEDDEEETYMFDMNEFPAIQILLSKNTSGMEDDLFTYDVGVLEPSYVPCVEYQYDDLENGDLDIFESRQCYDEYERILKFGDHKKVGNEIVEEVVSTWLIRSYKKQFEEYMEIKRQLEVRGINTDVECDPTNEDFAKWLASKFNTHMTMDWYTKDALWLYWKRRDDEIILTYDEISDLE